MITVLLLDLDVAVSTDDLIARVIRQPSRPLHVFYPKSAYALATAIARVLSATPVRLPYFDVIAEQPGDLVLLESCVSALVVDSVLVLLPSMARQQAVQRLQHAGGSVEHQDVALTVLSLPTAVWTCA